MKKIITQTLLATAFVLAATGHAQAQNAAPTPTPTVQPHGYMVISYDIKDQVMFQKYMDATGSLAAKYNGKTTIFNMKVKGMEGKLRSVFGMVDFPTTVEGARYSADRQRLVNRQA